MKIELILDLTQEDIYQIQGLAEDTGLTLTSLIEKLIKDRLERQLEMMQNFNDLSFKTFQKIGGASCIINLDR